MTHLPRPVRAYLYGGSYDVIGYGLDNEDGTYTIEVMEQYMEFFKGLHGMSMEYSIGKDDL